MIAITQLLKVFTAATVAVIACQGLFGAEAIAAQTKAAGGDKGERILQDRDLFPDDSARVFLDFVKGLDYSGAPAQGRAARLSDIESRYGKADRTQKVRDNEALSNLKGLPPDHVVHWYGQYGFCVNPSEGAGQVSWWVFMKAVGPAKSR